MTGWQRSSSCGDSACVEVHVRPDDVLVRDGKDPHGPVLQFTPGEWRVFVAGVRAGEFTVGDE